MMASTLYDFNAFVEKPPGRREWIQMTKGQGPNVKALHYQGRLSRLLTLEATLLRPSSRSITSEK